jgi:hypothetical protein
MTTPAQQQAYSPSTGLVKIPTILLRNKDPAPNNLAESLYSVWVNTETKAIWYLEAIVPSGGVLSAQWRAVAPIVTSSAAPTTADYLYPLGQTWVDTTLNEYWVMVAVSGTTGQWTKLASTSSFQVVSQQAYTASGVYLAPASLQYAVVECIGAGGAGGGPEATVNPNDSSVGGGGGAGEYSRGIFTAATIGVSQNFVIGIGGVGAAGATGGNGGASNFGALLSSNGGLGGLSSPQGESSWALGGLGGTGGTGGAVRFPGMSGFYGVDTGETQNPLGASGSGGSSAYGAGGASIAHLVAGQSVAGNVGLGYGSGGSGGMNNGFPQPAVAGGNGSDGVIIITEYISS